MMRSVLLRMALMLLNIHLGGALSGIASNFFSQSIWPRSGAKRFTRMPAPTTTAMSNKSFFIASRVPFRFGRRKGQRSPIATLRVRWQAAQR